MRFARRTVGENTEFWVSGVDPRLGAALETLAWEPRAGGWVKSFPRPVPEQAVRAFANVQRLLEPLLRQYLGMTAVPWQAALDEVCGRLESGGADWWLCGSAALAARGAAIVPRDLDRMAGQHVAGPRLPARVASRWSTMPVDRRGQASRAGKPPVATGPQRSGVTRSRDLP